MGVIKRIKKASTHKGKKFLLKKEPKLIEDCKQSLFLRGRKTNDTLMSCLRDLYSLKKPDAVLFGKKHDVLPFENVGPVEEFCRKFTASLFAFASSNKKRPNSVILGRTYDNQLLDMIELGIIKYKGTSEFEADTVMLGIKSCLLFAGPDFEKNSETLRLKNLLIDFFQREPVPAIRLQGLEHALMFTISGDVLHLRSYKIILNETGAEAPRVELKEIGPSVDFKIGRNKLASDDLFKTACKKPKELKAKKVKNVKTNVFGTKEAKIHVSRQNISKVQTKKMKGLRRSKRPAGGGGERHPRKKT